MIRGSLAHLRRYVRWVSLRTGGDAMYWYLQVLKRYAVFKGRARRKEYWMFFLVSLIIAVILGFVEGVAGITPESDESVLANVYSLAILLPAIAVGVRRMHDTDHSGWWLLS